MSNKTGMRIAYFAEIFPSMSETWIHHEILELQRLGCTVRVFATHPRPNSVPDELRGFFGITTYLPELSRSRTKAVWRILKPCLFLPVAQGLMCDANGLRRKAQVFRDLVYAGFLIPFVKDFSPDFLFAHFAGTRTNLAMFCSAIGGFPFGFKMHALDVFRRAALFRLKVARSAQIMTISRYNIEFIRQHHPDIDISRFQEHACGIPLHNYPYQSFRQVSDVPTILGVGRLVRMKGFDVLLKASRLLLDLGFRHRVVVIGHGPEREALECLCLSLGLRDTVAFKGYVGPHEVRDTLISATVFVLPAVWDPIGGTQDGIPVALMEAMALGVPVVSTTISGIPELVESGVTGFLSPPNDHVDLATQIKRCCELDDESREIMLTTARRKVEQNHDARRLTSSLLSMLKSSVPSADSNTAL